MRMLTFFLAALVIYIILGIIGFAVHGLIWLFIIAVVLFIGHLVFVGYRRGRHHVSSRGNVRR
jgi:uncharacterized membrane protein